MPTRLQGPDHRLLLMRGDPAKHGPVLQEGSEGGALPVFAYSALSVPRANTHTPLLPGIHGPG